MPGVATGRPAMTEETTAPITEGKPRWATLSEFEGRLGFVGLDFSPDEQDHPIRSFSP
jgi:hypothetical protein